MVIIASTVGVASILTAILHFQPQALIPARVLYSDVTVEGLKDTYNAGEPIDFVVKVEGYGCDKGFPSVLMKKIVVFRNQTEEEIVWSRLGDIRLLPVGYSCAPTDIFQVRHIGDVERYSNDEQERIRTTGSVPIIIREPGNYVVETYGGNAGGTSLLKGFSVVK